MRAWFWIIAMLSLLTPCSYPGRMRAWFWIIAMLSVGAACAGTDGPELVAAATPGPPTATPAPTPGVTPTATPIPTATAVPPTPTPIPTPTPEPDCVTKLPLRAALGQLVLPLAAPDQFAMVTELAAERQVAGVVVLGAPSVEDLMILPVADAAGVPLLWASDEEGGRVQRLTALLGPLPSARTLATWEPSDVTATYAGYGEGMRALGFSVAFAPVVDVGGGPGITDRSFSTDPDVVIEYGQAVIDGYVAGEVVPVIKHFPGHGRASADSHFAFSTTPPLAELREVDLLPFEALLDDEIPVMVGHLLVPGLTEDLPTSLSPAAIDGLLRDELGFGGLVITDSLSMNAISNRWDNAEATRLALVAGADLAILDGPEQVVPVLDHLEAAITDGTLTRAQVDDSVARVLAVKGADACAALS